MSERPRPSDGREQEISELSPAESKPVIIDGSRQVVRLEPKPEVLVHDVEDSTTISTEAGHKPLLDLNASTAELEEAMNTLLAGNAEE